MASETSMWISFFERAGLSPKLSLKYSMLFTDHRIQKDMLGDLTKSILNEMGITAVGDVLAILKRSKMEADQDEKPQTVKNITQDNRKTAEQKRTITTTGTAATSQTTAVTRGGSEPVQPKRIRLATPAPDHDVRYQVKMPEGNTARSRELLNKAKALTVSRTTKKPGSVFDRLGESVQQATSVQPLPSKNIQHELYRYISSRKNVSFATGTKESSPEVSSTTEEFISTLESDRVNRKVSALSRLGSKTPNETEVKEVVTTVGGQRRFLVAKRTTTVARSTVFERLG